MFSGIRKHLNPATVVAFAALVFAMTGGAFAMGTHGGGGSGATVAAAAKSKAKVKAGPRGPAGPAGKTGASGPAGATGPVGPAGAKGETGAAGANGVNGEKGETGATGATGQQGVAGPIGPKGEPWTPNNVLPAGASETGTWEDMGVTEKEHTTDVAISIPIPLKSDAKPHYVSLEEVEAHNLPAECKGTVEKPEAEAGNLCVFEAQPSVQAGVDGPGESEAPAFLNSGKGITSSEAEGSAGPSGAIMRLTTPAAIPLGQTFAYGSWAVTGN